ncbi:Phosphoglycerate mutase [Candidatus Magnetoovum chiemensis]|nr:Phosphoglycerate mutase [Candidatus Magnetoovum chiemensis]
MVTTVYLIRHGETVGGKEKRYKGHIDVALSENGEIQIKKTAEHLKKIAKNCRINTNLHSTVLDHIYCSDLSRAYKSAEIIGSVFDIKPVKIERLRERHFGKWEGMSFDEILAVNPKEFKAWAKDPLNFSPIDGESTLDVSLRAMPVFYELLNKHRGQKIAIVAHGGINRVIICDIIGIPLENIFRVEQDFACINIFEFYDDVPVAKLINYTM